MFRIVQYSIFALLLLCVSCTKQQQSSVINVQWSFSGDTAYNYIAQQVAFGPRVPDTQAHQACGDWLISELQRYGIGVSEQHGTMMNYAGKPQAIRNIIGHIPGNTPTAILLCAHWDTRPWSDEEEDYDNRFTPILGANDGASGVGILLEIARQLQILRTTNQSAQIPTIDVIFFDAEDMGTPSHYTGKERENTWCLGSQLWSTLYQQTPVSQRTNYQYGILLDMVGDPSATFPREYFSTTYAGSYVELIWRTAARLGYGRHFVNQAAYPITDDHYYVNTIAGIPCVDIIDYKPQNGTGFAEWWHTQQDNMQNINKQTLQAVGETVITTICSR